MPRKEKSVSVNYNEIPKKIKRRPYYIIAPGMIILVGIMIPFILAIFLSFTNYSFKSLHWHFVGFKNWIGMFTSGDFYHALLITLIYGISATLFQMILGTVVALLLKKDTLYSKVLKVL